MQVHVVVTNLSAERFWDIDKPLPGQVQIAVNISVIGFEQKGDTGAEAPYVFTVNFTPSVAQISIKGKAVVTGDKTEIENTLQDYKQQKAPIPIIQAIQSICTAEVILLSRSLGIPPPLPPLQPPQESKPDVDGRMRYA